MNATLISNLLKVEITRQYKKSFIGLTWIVITPIMGILVWLLLHYAGVYNPGDTGIPYPAFVLISTSIWMYFKKTYDLVSKSILQYGPALVQTNFSLDAIVVVKVLFSTVNFIIPFILSICVLFFYGVSFQWQAIFFFVALIPFILIGISTGMIISIFRAISTDIGNIADQIMNLLMFVTPVIYARNVNSDILQTIMYYNPLTYLLNNARSILVDGTCEFSIGYLMSILLSFILFIIVVFVYRRSAKVILERLVI